MDELFCLTAFEHHCITTSIRIDPVNTADCGPSTQRRTVCRYFESHADIAARPICPLDLQEELGLLRTADHISLFKADSAWVVIVDDSHDSGSIVTLEGLDFHGAITQHNFEVFIGLPVLIIDDGNADFAEIFRCLEGNNIVKSNVVFPSLRSVVLRHHAEL